MLPTTLQIAMLRAPFRFASRRAASVSAVSPGLRDDDRKLVGADDWVPIAILGSVVHFDGDLGERLDQILADERRVPGGTPGDDRDLLESAERLFRDVGVLGEIWPPFVETRPRMVSRAAVGCSKISLSMKCRWPPFSAAIGSQSTAASSSRLRVPK